MEFGRGFGRLGAMPLHMMEAELAMERMEMTTSCTHSGVPKWLFCCMFVWLYHRLCRWHSMSLSVYVTCFMVWLLMMGGPAQNGMLYMLFCAGRPPVAVFVVMV